MCVDGAWVDLVSLPYSAMLNLKLFDDFISSNSWQKLPKQFGDTVFLFVLFCCLVSFLETGPHYAVQSSNLNLRQLSSLSLEC